MANETIVRVSADAAGYVSGMEKAKKSAESFLASQDEAAKRTKAAQDAIAEAVASGSNANTRQINNFIQSLTRQADTIGKSRAELLEMKAAQLGVTNTAQAYIDQIKKAETGTHNFSIETAGARRELLVLAHEASQGNWSKFGGSLMVLGERTDALGAVMSTTGIVVAGVVATMGGIAVAAYKGAQQSDALGKSMQLTNGYIGITEGGFNALAKTMAVDTAQSIGKARDALQALTSTGLFSSTSLQAVGEAALNMAHLTGESADDVVKEFSKMADGVEKWALDANKHYHFLSLAQYDHIHLLEEQGKKQEAMKAAAEALNQTLGQEQPKNLGYLQRAWKSLGETASEAWERMMGLGRKTTVDDQIKQTTDRIAYLQGELKTHANDPGAQAIRNQIAIQQQALEGFRTQTAKEAAAAQKKSEQDQYQDSLVNARKYMNDMHDTIMSNAQRRVKEIKEYNKQADLLGIDPTQRAKDIAAINDKYKDHAQKAYHDDAATKFLQQLRDQDAAIRAQLSNADKLTGAEKQLAEFNQQIADIKEKKILTAEQKSLLANQDKIRAQLDQNVADEKALKTKQEIQKVEERSAQLNAQMATYQQSQNEQYQRQLEAFGQGSEALKQVQAVKSIYKEYERLQAELTKATPKDQLGSQAFLDEQEKIRAGLQQSLKDYAEYYKSLKEKQADWTNGATQAIQNYQDSATNMAAQTEAAFTSAFKGAEDALTNFVMTGKLSFSDLAKSIIADLVRIQAKKVVAGIAGSLGSIFGGGNVAGAGEVAAADDIGVGLAAFADGGDPPVGRASLVGERGPELFVPKTAGTVIPNHELGGAGGGQSITYSPIIQIDSRTDRNEVYALVDKAVKNGNAQLVDNLKRQGSIR